MLSSPMTPRYACGCRPEAGLVMPAMYVLWYFVVVCMEECVAKYGDLLNHGRAILPRRFSIKAHLVPWVSRCVVVALHPRLCSSSLPSRLEAYRTGSKNRMRLGPRLQARQSWCASVSVRRCMLPCVDALACWFMASRRKVREGFTGRGGTLHPTNPSAPARLRMLTRCRCRTGCNAAARYRIRCGGWPWFVWP